MKKVIFLLLVLALITIMGCVPEKESVVSEVKTKDGNSEEWITFLNEIEDREKSWNVDLPEPYSGILIPMVGSGLQKEGEHIFISDYQSVGIYEYFNENVHCIIALGIGVSDTPSAFCFNN